MEFLFTGNNKTHLFHIVFYSMEMQLCRDQNGATVLIHSATFNEQVEVKENSLFSVKC